MIYAKNLVALAMVACAFAAPQPLQLEERDPNLKARAHIRPVACPTLPLRRRRG